LRRRLLRVDQLPQQRAAAAHGAWRGKLEAFLGGGDWGWGEGGRAAVSEWGASGRLSGASVRNLLGGFPKNIQGPGNPGRREYMKMGCRICSAGATSCSECEFPSHYALFLTDFSLLSRDVWSELFHVSTCMHSGTQRRHPSHWKRISFSMLPLGFSACQEVSTRGVIGG
jgi:hypothetical protein